MGICFAICGFGMSDIRVAVQWKSSTVFAGEDVECWVTFKNVAQPNNLTESPSADLRRRDRITQRERFKDSLPPLPAKTHNAQTPPQRPPGENVYQASLRNQQAAQPHITPKAGGVSGDTAANGPYHTKAPHRRSISIISIGGDAATVHDDTKQTVIPRRPGYGHGRTSSLQVLPRRTGLSSPGPTPGRTSREFLTQ